MTSSAFDAIMNISNTTMQPAPSSTTVRPEIAALVLSDEVRYTYAALQLCILLLTLLGNAALILIIVLHRKLCTTTNILIANLAAGDIMLAVTVMPFDVDKLLRGYFAHSAAICEMSSTAFLLSLPASAVNLLVVTFERFCAVRFPLQHRTGDMFTRWRIVAILTCSWLYITIVALLPVMGWRSYPTLVFNGECMFYFEKEYAIFLLLANFLLPLFLIVMMNVWILKIVKYSMSQRREMHRSELLSRTSSLASNAAINQATSNRTTKIIAILVGVFAACWLPYIVNTSVNVICNGCSPPEINLTVMTLVFLNSAINPFLYGICKPQIRGIIKDRVRRLQARRLPSRRMPDEIASRVEETCL
eukprot:gene11213-12390_t